MPFRLALLAAGLVAAPAVAQKPAILVEPLPVPAGAPLSYRTLVRKPPAVPGVQSWTLETRRHRGQLYAAALSPDGKRVATGGQEGTVHVWAVATGELERILVGHDGSVYGVAWSPDGLTLASTGGGDATARLWDAATGRPLRVLRGHKGYAHHVAWSPDGKSLAVAGGTSGFVTLWDADKPKEVRTVETGNRIYGVAWAADNATVAVAGQTTSVATWDLRAGTQTRLFAVADKSGFAVAFSPDGTKLAGTAKGQTLLWEAATGKVLRTVADAWGPGLAFSPDGKTLALATTQSVGLIPSDDGGAVRSVAAKVTGVNWTPDGTRLLGPLGGTVELWTTDDAKEPEKTLAAAAGGPVLFAPGRPVVSGLDTPSPKLWDAATGKPVATLDGHTDAVAAAAWSRDGKHLATAGKDKAVRVWDAAGKPVATFEGHEKPAACVAWAADNKTLASGSEDNTVRVWTLGSTASKTLARHTEPVAAVAWSPAGKQLASGGGDNQVVVWVDLDKPPGSIPVPVPVASLAWGPAGKGLAAGLKNGDLTVFHSVTGKALQTYDRRVDPADVTALTWTADGTTVVAGRAGEMFQAWRTGNNKQPTTDVPVFAAVSAVGLSAGGTTLVTSGDGRTARVWDMPAGTPRAALVADDKQLVAVSAAGHFRAADEAACELVYVAQTAKGQDMLTPKEFAERYKFKNNPAAVVLLGK